MQALQNHSAPVAQGIEHRIPNPGAAGSIPAWSTNKIKGLHCSPGGAVLLGGTMGGHGDNLPR